MTATGNDFILNVKTQDARKRLGGNVPPLPEDADDYLDLLRLAVDANDDGGTEPPTISYETGSETANAQALRTWNQDRQTRWRDYQMSPGYNKSREAKNAVSSLSGAVSDLIDCPDGQRNSVLNAKAWKLGRFVNAGILARATVESALLDACRGNGLLRDDGERAVRATMDSGLDSAASAKVMPFPLRERSRIRSPKANKANASESYDSMMDAKASATLLDVSSIDTTFWESRESLRNIYVAALAKMCSPWAVLAFCVARALAQVRPHIVLPDVIGGPGSLNWFGAIAATSGGGKGAASATARMLVTDPVQQRNTGSGEGMVGAYVKPADGITGEPKGSHESIMFNVDEIDSLTAQSNRSGATTMSVLRSAFSGETLGFSYVNKNTPTLEAHTYRMTMIVSVQPQRAAGLLADAAGGTPQRFMWFPGTDTRITKDTAGSFIAPLTLPKPGTWQYPTTLRIPEVARELILDTRVQAVRGERDALDGHALFCREKFAFALALLDGRAEMSQADWELSGIAAEVSDDTRNRVLGDIAAARTEQAIEDGRELGQRRAASDDEQQYQRVVRRAKVVGKIVGYLSAGDKTRREIGKQFDSRSRPHALSVLDQLVSDERVVKSPPRKGDRVDTERYRLSPEGDSEQL